MVWFRRTHVSLQFDRNALRKLYLIIQGSGKTWSECAPVYVIQKIWSQRWEVLHDSLSFVGSSLSGKQPDSALSVTTRQSPIADIYEGASTSNLQARKTFYELPDDSPRKIR